MLHRCPVNVEVLLPFHWWEMGHIWYINILTLAKAYQGKLLYLVLFCLYPSLNKRKLKKFQFWPESLGAMLEYLYIERGLLDLWPEGIAPELCVQLTNFLRLWSETAIKSG